PMPKTRPAATDGVLKPPPRPLACQASGGPFLGQLGSKPFSAETALRSWPCHRGQSKGLASKGPAAAAQARIRNGNRDRSHCREYDIVFSVSFSHASRARRASQCFPQHWLARRARE